MKNESSTAGFEQASADAEKLAAELAAIRKQLTELRQQNATFLATDPVTGVASARASEAASGAGAPSQPMKEPQVAGAGRKGTAVTTAGVAEPPAASGGETSGAEEDQGRRKWWRKPKTSDTKQSGF